MDTTNQHKAFMLLLALVTLAFFRILLPFYGAVLWAVILVIIFQPLHRVVERLLAPRSNLAAAASTLVCIVIAVIPMLFLVLSLFSEASQLVGWLQDGGLPAGDAVEQFKATLPVWAQHGLDRLGIDDLPGLLTRLRTAISQAGEAIAASALAIGQDTLHLVASIGIMLYLLFHLFRDGRPIAGTIRDALPLSEEYSRRLVPMFAAVVRATVKGNLVIALVQGTIGGVTLWLLGFGAPLLWGALMTILSMIPAVGSALIWAPIAAYLFLSGSTVKAVILVLVGTAVIGLVDNLLRPALVGKDTQLPDYVILISTLGGLSVFGLNGFVVGPLIAALFIACWKLYSEEQRPNRGAR
jgi:predicted PurR-regulated permease PerM